MAKDAGTKQDQPKADVEPDAKVQQDAAEAKAAEAADKTEEKAAATEQKPPKKAPAKKKPAAKKATGTAAKKTAVDKEAAEAGASGAEATEEKPKPKRTRKPAAKKTDEAKAEDAKADEAVAEEKPKPARKPRAKKTETPEPAPAPKREERDLVTVRAQAKFVRTSARKARLVAEHVRGKDVQQARAILAFSPRSVAEDWRKVLESAIANAEHNHDLVGDDLRVLNATADEGPTLKRYRPRAMGRATRIRKRTSHLTITLTPKD
jgi:ribosomal protein L22